MTHRASHQVQCIQEWMCLSFPPSLESLELAEVELHDRGRRSLDPQFGSVSLKQLISAAIVLKMKEKGCSDWRGQSACNELVSYFTAQPLKRLVKTTLSCIFTCVLTGHVCSFWMWRDLCFCAGIRVATRTRSSVKRTKPSPDMMWASLTSRTWVRIERDASRGEKQQVLKQAGIVLRRPPCQKQRRRDWVKGSTHECKRPSLSFARTLSPPSEVQADCERWWLHAAFYCRSKRPLKSHQFIPAHFSPQHTSPPRLSVCCGSHSESHHHQIRVSNRFH